jgi:hypothetical protein
MWVRAVLLLALSSAIVACEGAESRPVNGPDGEGGWYTITCRHDMGNCEEEAGNLCPHGYVTADADESEHPVAFSTYNQSGGTTYVGHKFRGHMLVKCKSRHSADD